MMERVQTSQAVLNLVWRGEEVHSGPVHHYGQVRSAHAHKSAVPMHTPETKQQSKQWLEKGLPWL